MENLSENEETRISDDAQYQQVYRDPKHLFEEEREVRQEIELTDLLGNFSEQTGAIFG